MPYADNRGVRIHYQVEGNGPPLVMLHGFRDSGEGWRQWGYVDQLRGDYRIALMDARGHGGSDKPHDAESYTIDKLASDVAAVIDDFAGGKSNFWGYSMGGRTGFGVARDHGGKLNSLIIGGMGPGRRNTGQPRREGPNPMLEALRGGMESMVAWREANGRPLTPEERKVLMANDPLALAACLEANMSGAGLVDSLPEIRVPSLFYGGTNDGGFYNGVNEWAPQVPNSKVVILEGEDHGSAFDRSDLILPHAKEFLKAANAVPS
jgi:pimeloyl-ACP methyl ester carboxylesterase